MIIDKEKNGTDMVIHLAGRIDSVTAPNFDVELKSAIVGIDTLTLDMEKLDYMSSACLRVLLSVQKIMNARGGMKVIHVNDVIMEIFDITGFSAILTIE
ncbi:MAG: STAS domain-containing protein [Succinivibrionaceae bacterium]|nr:STAS domain-containing protein [Succinivibrionaceae bacterium]